MVLPKLLLFTDVVAPRRHQRGLFATIARAFNDLEIEHAADVAVCVRMKQAAEVAVADACRVLQHILAPAHVSVFVHGHAALVGSLHLQGAHLSSSATADDLRHARLQMPPGSVLGLSAHPSADAAKCVRDDVDYCTWSPVFSPSSKGDARQPIGLHALRGHTTPVLALGGIDVDTAAACFENGAAGIAVIGAVLGAARPDLALQRLLAVCGIAHHRRRGFNSVDVSRGVRGARAA